MRHLYKLILFGAVLALNGCSDFEIGTVKFKRDKGPSDLIPYEALGSGKLAFMRDRIVILDADAKNTWGLTGMIRGGVISPNGLYVAIERLGSSERAGEILVYDIDRNTFTVIPDSRSSIIPGWTADSQYVLCLTAVPTLPTATLFDDILQRVSITGWNKSTVATLTHARGPSFPVLTSIISGSLHDDLTFTLNKSVPGSVDSGIYTIKLDGSGLTKIVSDTSLTARVTSPCWSPNGEQVAYMHFQLDGSNSVRQTKVNVMKGDGSKISTLATFQSKGTHEIVYPHQTAPSIAWSPDGTKLAFNMFEENGVHIYVMKVDGSGLTQVTSLPGAEDGQLSWSR